MAFVRVGQRLGKRGLGLQGIGVQYLLYGVPLYEALVQLGRLLRTVFLADYFVNEAFRRQILRVLNRGESVNALKRSIYVGRVAGYQAKQPEEMQAVADAHRGAQSARHLQLSDRRLQPQIATCH